MAYLYTPRCAYTLITLLIVVLIRLLKILTSILNFVYRFYDSQNSITPYDS
jgi:hypothetical protein